MRKIMRSALWGLCALFVLELLPGCAGTMYIRPAQPPRRVEDRGRPPSESAVWIDGSWRWGGHGGGWVWTSGHWKETGRKDRGLHRGQQKKQDKHDQGRGHE